MPCGVPVQPETFAGLQNVDIDRLSSLPEAALRPILPCLVRMSLCAPLDASSRWTLERKKILKCLSGIEVVNSLVGLLSIDFHELEQDARKELQLRAKVGGNQTESHVIAALPHGIALEFERCDAARKLRLMLSELLFILYQMKLQRTDYYLKSSELFESEVYLEEVSDVLCIAQAELPGLLPIVDLAEVLLHVQNGTWLLCRVVANSPDSFYEVCSSLVAAAVDRQDEDSASVQKRSEALLMLCEMCPSCAVTVRHLCVQNCKLPSLAVTLALRYDCQTVLLGSRHEDIADCPASPDAPADEPCQAVSGIVAFVSGLLLDNNANVRNWFSDYIRSALKKREAGPSVTALRQELLNQLNGVLSSTNQIAATNVMRGCAFVRLYAALKCIAAIRFLDEENVSLLQLITCRPPLTKAGIRFASLGLCLLLACPTMISGNDQKAAVIDWIKWLVKEGEHFEQVSGVHASFGGMLLLIAIHFHSNQISAINDLVSSTLGMKTSVKGNALAHLKTIFTQDIFTEQVVTAHAVKVAVTNNLSANMSGYLPVHCIYQLLRSRTFAKHQVRITEWVYRQLCCCRTPVHPVIAPLIEAFVTSIIVPAARTDCTNEPIPEDELCRVFSDPFCLAEESSGNGGGVERERSPENFTRLILLVYYILLYEDTLLANTTSIVSWNRKIHRYSPQLMSRLPMKFVLQLTQKHSMLYSGIYAPLLRLIASHYPHHCLVSDSLDEEMIHSLNESAPKLATAVDTDRLADAFANMTSQPSQCILLLERLLTMTTFDLMPYRNTLITNLRRLLDDGTPRRCQDLVHQVWLKMNGLFSGSLRSQTVNVLRPQHTLFSCISEVDYTEDDITLDPLIVLRCDDRVFRCPPLLSITLKILEAFLQASRSYLSKHMQAHPLVDKSGQVVVNDDCEKLRIALLAAQESAAVQILLECCLPMDDNEQSGTGLLTNWREVQGIICSHLHQIFIADPGLVKLVHFQGYPRELLPLTVAGIPSMHICLDFIPELIALPDLDKVIFSIDLISYLCQQYALPKSLHVARLAITVISTMISVLPHDTRPDFFVAVLPSLARFCRVFPPLSADTVSLLLQLGRVVHSHLSLLDSCAIGLVHNGNYDAVNGFPSSNAIVKQQPQTYANLYAAIFKTFNDIVGSTVLLRYQLHCQT